jgi:3-oxoacyl-(acyl-carrier-protein) synthase
MIYIQSAAQISTQPPLSDAWFEAPLYHDARCVRSIDPTFTDYLPALQSRRLCNLLKRALVTARTALHRGGALLPDAIISATGLGCIENTERFMRSIVENGERLLQPTYFMQSTHNVLSSSIAIDLLCHGYNNTFVHRDTSFEHALLDAILQFRLRNIHTALVGGYDEITPNYFRMLGQLGYWDFGASGQREEEASAKQRCFAGETAVSLLLSDARTEETLCELSGVELLYRPSVDRVRQALHTLLAQAGCSLSEIDVVMTGINHHAGNDAVYDTYLTGLLPTGGGACPVAQYKHLFGQSFTTSAAGVYAAATCLYRQRVPAHLMAARSNEELRAVKRILLYNHHHNRSHTLILLSRC